MLTPNKEHNKIFPNMPIIGFPNVMNLKDYLVGAKLSKLEENGRCEPCGTKIDTATTCTINACQKNFKI